MVKLKEHLVLCIIGYSISANLPGIFRQGACNTQLESRSKGWLDTTQRVLGALDHDRAGVPTVLPDLSTSAKSSCEKPINFNLTQYLVWSRVRKWKAETKATVHLNWRCWDCCVIRGKLIGIHVINVPRIAWNRSTRKNRCFESSFYPCLSIRWWVSPLACITLHRDSNPIFNYRAHSLTKFLEGTVSHWLCEGARSRKAVDIWGQRHLTVTFYTGISKQLEAWILVRERDRVQMT